MQIFARQVLKNTGVAYLMLGEFDPGLLSQLTQCRSDARLAIIADAFGDVPVVAASGVTQ